MTTVLHAAYSSAPLSWAEELRQSFGSMADLEEAGWLPQGAAEAGGRAEAKKLKFRVPRAYAARFDYDNLERCPLFLQAVPSLLEEDPSLPAWAQALSQKATGRACPWQTDATGDVAHSVAPRLTHRYQNRVIIHATLACGLYCRFCFRKGHMANHEERLYGGSFEAALAYLERTPGIDEVILTGGDPLSLSDAALGRLISRIDALGSVKVVRLHTRMPGVLPSRLTRELAETLTQAAKSMQICLAAHINHPNELTEQTRLGFEYLRSKGIVLLHQAVLLRHVNDHAETLASLFKQLWHWGCTPYYLHHPDWTPDTFGFRVSIEKGRHLMAQLGGRLSGPALPTYVLDVPGGAGKVCLTDHGVCRSEDPKDCGADARMVGQLWKIRHTHTRTGSTNDTSLYFDLAAR